jgi:hypothetical protein
MWHIRKLVLKMFERAIEVRPDGTYEREDLIHKLIMPMRKSSEELMFEECNLWIIDERLAFHDYLASDKPIKSMPIATTGDERPDFCILDVMDEPVLVGEKSSPATLTIIELKRPMRTGFGSPNVNPIDQCLGYLRQIRSGGATTKRGRPIAHASEIPGFVYVIADLTPEMVQHCVNYDLTASPDKIGYFGFHRQHNTYIEVLSFDALLKRASERNRAFFDKLGLPTE